MSNLTPQAPNYHAKPAAAGKPAPAVYVTSSGVWLDAFGYKCGSQVALIDNFLLRHAGQTVTGKQVVDGCGHPTASSVRSHLQSLVGFGFLTRDGATGGYVCPTVADLDNLYKAMVDGKHTGQHKATFARARAAAENQYSETPAAKPATARKRKRKPAAAKPAAAKPAE